MLSVGFEPTPFHPLKVATLPRLVYESIRLAGLTGFEPATSTVTGWRASRYTTGPYFRNMNKLEKDPFTGKMIDFDALTTAMAKEMIKEINAEVMKGLKRRLARESSRSSRRSK